MLSVGSRLSLNILFLASWFLGVDLLVIGNLHEWIINSFFYFNFNLPSHVYDYYIPRRKSGIYWIQVRRAAAAVEISLWTR